MMTYFQASATLKAGDRVKLTEAYGDYPMSPIPKGATGEVIENGLNEMQPLLFIKLDETFDTLKSWDNVLQIAGPETPDSTDWQRPIPVAMIA